MVAEGGAARVQNEVFVTGIGRVQVVEAIKPYARAALAADRYNLFAFWNSRTSLDPQVALSSGALAASKRHDATANAYGRSIDDLCRQTGPITLPETHPICNTKDFMGW